MIQRRFKTKKRAYKIKPLSNYDILALVTALKIPFFKGVYMRDTLKGRPKSRECLILNHGSIKSDGTHWTALVKNYDKAYYFDSFGKLPPPLELLNYLNQSKTQLYYNVQKYQNYGTVICGHLCVKFLHDFWFPQKKNI